MQVETISGREQLCRDARINLTKYKTRRSEDAPKREKNAGVEGADELETVTLELQEKKSLQVLWIRALTQVK